MTTEVKPARNPYAGMSAKVIRSLVVTEKATPEKLSLMLAYVQAQREKFVAAGKSASKIKLWDRALADVTSRAQAFAASGIATPAAAFTFVDKPVAKKPKASKAKAKAVAKPSIDQIIAGSGMTREQLLLALARAE